MQAVEIANISKTFGEVKAVEDLSLEIPERVIYGLIGPNGSGKTTTMRMIVNIFYPDCGEIRLFGSRMLSARSGFIGYLPEERGLYRKMVMREALEFYGDLRGGASAEIREWLDRLDLTQRASDRIENLSKGMSQKVQFIAAVVPRPKLLILDEPFTGLDPVSADEIREAILELRRLGTTVVLSTHDMAVAESMCDFICMIFRGHKVLDGTLANIQGQYADDTIRVSLDGGSPALGELPGVCKVRDLGRIQELRLAPGADPQDVLRALMAQARVTGFSVMKPSLHDIFVRIAGPAAEEAVVA